MAKQASPSKTTTYLNELLSVFFHNLLFYIPSKLFNENILKDIEDQIPEFYFDELSLYDNKMGVYSINNQDGPEVHKRILQKNVLLEQHTFRLLEIEKELTPLEFELIIQKYADELQFFCFITYWLSENVKIYHKEKIQNLLVGAFVVQHQQFSNHLIEIVKYFYEYLDTQKEYDYSIESLVMVHLQSFVSRLNQINEKEFNEEEIPQENEITTKQEIKNNEKENLTKRTKKRPQLNIEEIEKSILESVFKVKMK